VAGDLSASLPDRIRHRFPVLERLVYVNSCSQGALSDSVRDAYAKYLDDWDEHGSPWEYWVERAETARTTFARLVNANPDEVAVTTSLSAGVSALASGLDFASGRDKVVMTDYEFPTIGQIWHAQELRGARVEIVEPEPERLAEAIDEQTALVSITHVSYRNGTMLDVEPIVRLGHERGALVLLDAYQTVGSLPVDVRGLGVDFLAAGVLKYLLGSAGLAFFYCRRDLVERFRPTATGWFADEDIFRMDHRDYSPAPTARRFEAGTPPVPSIYAGVAGMELMEEIGIGATREHVQELNAYLLEGFDDIAAKLVTPLEPNRRGALLCVRSTDSRGLVSALAADRVVTSERDGNLRVSMHCYNSRDDADAVVQALARHRALLA
jgi:selenocysteine lyase/cysteine desulfurase